MVSARWIFLPSREFAVLSWQNISKAMPMIMPHRYDCMNMITLDIPLEPMREYVNKRRLSELPVSHLAIIIAAFVRTVSQYPLLNRFVVNKKFYARNEKSLSDGVAGVRCRRAHDALDLRQRERVGIGNGG